MVIDFFNIFSQPFEEFTNPSKRIYWQYILSAYIIALIYLAIFKKEKKINLSGKLWFHKSAILDYKYFFLSFFIKIIIIVPIIVGAKDISIFVYEFLLNNYGLTKIRYLSYSQVILLFTVSLFIINDFTRYWLHRLFHLIPYLWEFHKVHHSAKILTPITFYRVHPIENLLFGFRYALSTGLVVGIFTYLFGSMISIIQVVGINIFLFLFSIIGTNLRHSHIKIRYPKFIEQIVISPYQHQLHHSTKYYNKNFGGYLAIWDFMFKTLQTSKNIINKKEKIHFGIKTKKFKTILNLLFLPFINILNILITEKNMKKYNISLVIISTLLLFIGCNSNKISTGTNELINKKEIILGEKLFFDTLLSKNNTQSCATCHNPKFGFIDNRNNGVKKAGSLGDDQQSIGDRNTPTISYAMFSPQFHYDSNKKQYIGGQFYDGREKDLKGQAGMPPLNLVEMGIPSKDFMVKRLKNSKEYNLQFKDLYGKDIFENNDKAYEMMTKAIAKFETTKIFAPFDSKYDKYLNGEYNLTNLEDLGKSLFFSQTNNNCASCHLLKKEDKKKETFTNYQYHNIGVPQNHNLMAKNVVDSKSFIDHGLMNNSIIKKLHNSKDYDGKIKVPTLRNIAITGPYMHNGVFQKLSTVVKFYDKYINKNRDMNPETNKPWEKPEVQVNKNDLKLLTKGNSLNEKKIKALIAFMNLLTDKKYEHLIKKDN